MKTKYLASAWDGEGAKGLGGRWNSVGTPLVYTAATLSLALVENLVHLPSGLLPSYSAIQIEFDQSLVIDLDELPADWRRVPPTPSTQTVGDRWVSSSTSAILRVPSVVVPGEFNFLVNPQHADFRRIEMREPQAFPFDQRLVKSQAT
jgi:RES domain-containing protein